MTGLIVCPDCDGYGHVADGLCAWCEGSGKVPPLQELRDLIRISPCSDVGPVLFDSIEYRDHLKARETCLRCASRDACRRLALADKNSTGTFGGDLFRDGSVIMAIDS